MELQRAFCGAPGAARGNAKAALAAIPRELRENREQRCETECKTRDNRENRAICLDGTVFTVIACFAVGFQNDL